MNEIVDGGITWDDLDWLCANTTAAGVAQGRHAPRRRPARNRPRRRRDWWSPITAAVSWTAPRPPSTRCRRWLGRWTAGCRCGWTAASAGGRTYFTALALGADGVMIGRPALWGLTVDGAAGVAAVLEILARELANTMSLCGCASLAAIHRDCLFDTRAIESR